MRRYVIVGSGAAGLAAAETLRETDPTSKVSLVTRDRYGYYSRPGLAYLLAGEIDEGQLYPYQPDMLRRLGVEWMVAEAGRLAPDEHRLYLKDGRSLPYDRLLLATGATAVMPNLPGNQLEGVVTLDDVEDVHSILRKARRGNEAIVVGGGITALELVEGLAAQKMKVHYLLRGDRYWSSVLDPEESELVQERLREDGVMIHTRSNVAEIFGRREVEGVHTQEGQTFRGRMVAFAIGIRPRLELARSAGLQVGRGIQVNAYLQTSDPDIFAAGDGAEWIDPRTGKGILESLWNPARSQGRTAGRNMAGFKQPYQRVSPINVTRLAGLVTTIIGQVGEQKRDPDRDTNGIMRGDSETWRQVTEAMVAQTYQGPNRLRLYVGQRTLYGALIMGDQTLSRTLQHFIEDEVDISPIRPALLAPNADLARILSMYEKVAIA